MTGASVARMSLVLFVFVAVQQTLGVDLHVGSAHPDLMLLIPIVAGVRRGPQQGAVVGFVAGLVADLFLPTPFGLSALVGCLMGFGVGVVVVPIQSDVWWLPPIAALGASIVGTVLFPVLGAVLGEPQMLQAHMVSVVFVVTVTNTVLAGPATRFVAWALPETAGDGLSLTTAGDFR